ncbi:MAG TPA: helix-turn-helix domain-containing protein [Rhizomicrobium sp.]|jgi:AraC-like DNA-binding protein
MKFPPPDYRFLRFWTDEYPAHQRIGAWRQVLSQMLLKCEVEALSAEPFQVQATLRALAGIRFGSGHFSPSVHRRTAEMVAEDDSDDLLLMANMEGSLSILFAGTELIVREGDACIMSCRDEFDSVRYGPGRLMFARLEREPLAGLLPDVDRFLRQVILRGNEGLWHVTTFLRKLDDRQPLETDELRRVVVTHIFNALALTLNLSRDGRRSRPAERPAATRLAAIQRYLTEHLADQELSLATVAAANRLSARQVQRLFEASGTTLSEFLLRERLKSVHAALLDAGQAERSVSDIALANGFGDVSYFNRAFRRHYGKSPSEVRRAATVPPLASAG